MTTPRVFAYPALVTRPLGALTQGTGAKADFACGPYRKGWACKGSSPGGAADFAFHRLQGALAALAGAWGDDAFDPGAVNGIVTYGTAKAARWATDRTRGFAVGASGTGDWPLATNAERAALTAIASPAGISQDTVATYAPELSTYFLRVVGAKVTHGDDSAEFTARAVNNRVAATIARDKPIDGGDDAQRATYATVATVTAEAADEATQVDPAIVEPPPANVMPPAEELPEVPPPDTRWGLIIGGFVGLLTVVGTGIAIVASRRRQQAVSGLG